MSARNVQSVLSDQIQPWDSTYKRRSAVGVAQIALVQSFFLFHLGGIVENVRCLQVSVGKITKVIKYTVVHS